jgi:hypothetical protein
MPSVQSIVRASTGDGGVVARRFGADTLLVPVCSGVGDLDSVYTLNEVGTTIWEAMADPVSRGDLVAAITREYDVTAEEAEHDLDAFLHDLTLLRLVRILEQGDRA